MIGSRARGSRIAGAGVVAALLLTGVQALPAAAASVNLASKATVTATSQNTATSQTAAKAVDGVAQGYPVDATKEWASVGGKSGTAITLTWPAAVFVDQIRLYDRPNLDDRITGGTFTFDDGSTAAVGSLTNNGTAVTAASFSTPKRITKVTFTVTSVASTTYNAGLAEIEVFGTEAPAENQKPTADAGASFSSVVGKSTKLDGSKSKDPDGSVASYTWTVESQPSGSSVSLANTASPSFTPAVAGTYVFGLVVTDNAGASSSKATVTVTVTPPPPNQPPKADAGPDQTVSVNSSVTLTGAASADPDGTIAAYAWTQVSGPVASLSSTSAAKPTFTPTAVGAYVFGLVVTDDKGAVSPADQVRITVTDAPVVPLNLAGQSAVTASSDNVATNQQSAKAVDGVAQGYPADSTKEWATKGGKAGSWIQLAWPAPVSLGKVVLYDRPNSDDQITGGTLTFSDGSSVAVGALTNTSGSAGSAAGVPVTFPARTVTWARLTVDKVSATTHNVGLAEFEAWGNAAGPVDLPPVVNAGTAQTVASAQTGVTLNGSASRDPEGGALTYEWAQTAGTPVTLSGATTAISTFDAPAVTAVTPLTFRLTVRDPGGQSASGTVVVTVSPPATVTATDAGAAGSFAIGYGSAFAGKTATLQVQTIATTMTTENPTSSWKALGTVVLNSSGAGTVTVADPYEVTHQYRAVVSSGGIDSPTNTVPYAAVRPNKNLGLPALYLDTNESAAISDRDTDHEGAIQLVPGSGNWPACTAVPRDTKVKAAGRGNSTWNLPKRPYKFSTDKKTALCGIPAGKKWALLANYEDVSLMRNMVALQMGSQLDGLAWTPRTHPVDLYLNGSYKGQYLLAERITIGATRVDIDELKIDPSAPGAQDVAPEVTGGYLMEWNHGQAGDAGVEPPDITTDRGGLYLKEPDAAAGEITPVQEQYIADWMDEADRVLFDDATWLDPDNGWRKYIDESSAIDFWIVNEVTKNYGANYRSSAWMYKARDVLNPDGTTTVGKLYHGPLWDFDTGQGNADYGAGQASTSGWWMRDSNDAPRQASVTWMNRLFQDPEFKAAAKARWQQVSPQLKDATAWLGVQQPALKASADADHALWGLGSYSTDANALRAWLSDRIAWIDANFR
ncbi:MULTISPECIES: DUF7402 domain-containing protein [unclassified Microbacterium]|uniref:DUF7402 domain-containing protein n=1 Tax=unclassified Microbacterium TaxID=2609290 RepID=UPI003016B5A0